MKSVISKLNLIITKNVHTKKIDSYSCSKKDVHTETIYKRKMTDNCFYWHFYCPITMHSLLLLQERKLFSLDMKNKTYKTEVVIQKLFFFFFFLIWLQIKLFKLPSIKEKGKLIIINKITIECSFQWMNMKVVVGCLEKAKFLADFVYNDL